MGVKIEIRAHRAVKFQPNPSHDVAISQIKGPFTGHVFFSGIIREPQPRKSGPTPGPSSPKPQTLNPKPL